MQRLVLDTSAYSRLRSGHGPLLDLLASAEALLMPVTVLGELEAAFELGTRGRANRQSLAEFVAEPFVTVLPVTPDVARRYGQLFAQQRRAAQPVPVNDLWIAATAVDCGGQLVTYDRDFARIAGLDCAILEA